LAKRKSAFGPIQFTESVRFIGPIQFTESVRFNEQDQLQVIQVFPDVLRLIFDDYHYVFTM